VSGAQKYALTRGGFINASSHGLGILVKLLVVRGADFYHFNFALKKIGFLKIFKLFETLKILALGISNLI
jgi:hypothetical protein